MRTAEANFVTGPGVLLAIITGVVYLALARSTMAVFRRSKVFAGDEAHLADDPAESDATVLETV